LPNQQPDLKYNSSKKLTKFVVDENILSKMLTTTTAATTAAAAVIADSYIDLHESD